MRAFARLFTALDETTRTGEKVGAMAAYFTSAPPPRTPPGRSTS